MTDLRKDYPDIPIEPPADPGPVSWIEVVCWLWLIAFCVAAALGNDTPEGGFARLNCTSTTLAQQEPAK